ncbi:hypothetical protein [Aquisphaera insulae]|uniref:hypothetical protein n=1 Tax=Aquisphaera insulae TaxID=2712864 RepID=UPI0013EDEBD3|nr:hypothetical protein [Aquisphaera insulae]
MAGPSIAYSTAGQDNGSNTLYNGSLAAATTSSPFTFDLSTGGAFGGVVGFEVTAGGSVSGTNGCRLDLYDKADASNYELTPSISYTFSPVVVSTTYRKAVRVPTGQWSGKVTNLDAGQPLSSVKVTSSKLS